jgi:hypothetical protein
VAAAAVEKDAVEAAVAVAPPMTRLVAAKNSDDGCSMLFHKGDDKERSNTKGRFCV